MQAYRIAVFLAIIGALTGALNSTMSYTERPWFPGSSNTSLPETMSLSGENITTATDITESSTTSVGMTIQEFTVLGTGLSMLKGIFLMGSTIDSMLFNNQQSAVRTAFLPFLNILTLGVNFIYMIAGLQIWRKTPLAGAY